MLVAIIGLDDEFAKEFAKSLASKLDVKYKDFDSELSYYFTFQKVTTLQTANEEYISSEIEFIKKLLKENVIISIPNDVYVSNKNYELFKDVLTIFIERKESKEVLKNIQKLIKKHCKIVIKQEKLKEKIF